MSETSKQHSLFVVGMPLHEENSIGWEASQLLEKSVVIIAESRKIAYRYLKRAGVNTEGKELFFLDPFREDEWKRLQRCVEQLRGVARGDIALFSDVGMPILFDPGREVLDLCLKNDFTVRSVPGPTSWATACALSGFLPPFKLVGFLSREAQARMHELSALRNEKSHCVLMDTPYRFRVLLKQSIASFGPLRFSFLAWEIGKTQEIYLWDTLGKLEKHADSRNLQKGEFILIVCPA